jgi:predicted nucleic acid-binding protein
MSWCFVDEGDEYAIKVLRLLNSYEAIVPCVWPLEVTNALLMAERRGRITPAKSLRFLSMLFSYNIAVSFPTPIELAKESLLLGRQNGLTSYDAAYLELAMREGLPLASLDNRLIDAAKALGIPIQEA